MIGGTLLAKFVDLKTGWNIKEIGDIPTGFPEATSPDLSLFQELLPDCFTIAIVSYTVSVSMALIFAQKAKYEIDFNQELLAMGTGNIFGSFFYCMPFSASLSRSNIQMAVGGKTQLASIVSCLILAVVLLWIGPFFEVLPKVNLSLIPYSMFVINNFISVSFQCILASVIVVALKGMLMQLTELFTFCKLSRMDALVWLGTFLAVVIVSIDIGLLVGIILSILSIFIRGLKPYTCLLGNVPGTDLYLDTKRYQNIVEIPKIKIFHYCGSLNFASRNSFKSELLSLIKLDVVKELKRMVQSHKKDIAYESDLKCLIIDFTALSYIDSSGTKTLKLLINDINQLSILVCFAGSSSPVYEMMKKCDVVENSDGLAKFFPTLHDAVFYAMEIVRPSNLDIINNYNQL